MTTEICDLNQGPYLGQTSTGASPLHMGMVELQGIEEDMNSSGKGIDLGGHDWFW